MTPKPNRHAARQERFVAEYLIDLNATQAAIRAGYSRRTAASQGYDLLRKPEIIAALAQAQASRAKRTGITQDRVLAELEQLAFSDVSHYQVNDDGEVTLAPEAPAQAMRAIASIKRRITTRGGGEHAETTRDVEIRLWDKPGPLKLAGQHVGLLTDKIEHSGRIAVETDGLSDAELDARARALVARLAEQVAIGPRDA